MAIAQRPVTRILALFVVAAIPLIPDPPMPFERAGELDLELVRSAEVEYRGITGTFDELTRAYALRAYEGAELLGWEARPNPLSPETEALVAARFRVAGARHDSSDASGRPELRNRVDEILEVTWRLNSLSTVHVHPHDDYARDALDVYQHTVDRLLDRMVYVAQATHLRRSPDDGADLRRLEVGTVLMRDAQEGDWAQVRVPSDTTVGWLPVAHLRPVYGDED